MKHFYNLLPTLLISSLGFGALTPNTIKDLTFRIDNTRTAPLQIAAFHILGNNFSIVSPSAPFNIAANGDQEVILRHTANTIEGNANERLTIVNSDSDEGSCDISLVGQSLTPCAQAVIDTTTITNDCDNNQFSVVIDFLSVGDATDVIDDSFNSYVIGSGQTSITVGPYIIGDLITLTVFHNNECTFEIPGTFSGSCPSTIFEDFNDGNFSTNPIWTGDTSAFSVISDASIPNGAANTDGLYLASNSSQGDSALAVESTEIIEWKFSLASPNFNPSSGNQFGVVLMSDNPLSGDIHSIGNSLDFQGYYILVGANGSSDPIELYRKTGTGRQKIGDFPNSANYSSALPNGLNIRITRSTAGEFELFYSDGFTYDSDPTNSAGTLTDNSYNTSSYFGVFQNINSPSADRRVYIDNIELVSLLDKDSRVVAPVAQVATGTLDALLNTNISNAIDVLTFTIEDLGTTDNAPTEVTQLRLIPGPQNTASWTQNIQGIRITSSGAGGLVAQSNQDEVIDDNQIIIDILDNTDTEMTIPDGVSQDYTISVFLNDTGLTDNGVIQFAVPTATNNWSVANTGSSAFEANFSGVIGHVFDIDVTATNFEFITNPRTTFVDDIMAPAVQVALTDANGNIDGGGDTVTITSSGVLAGNDVTNNEVTVIPEAGIATFNLVHSQLGTGLTLTASTANQLDITSIPFDIVDRIDLIIGEVADPDDDFDGRFVELYNNGTLPIDLGALDIYFARQANADAFESLALTGTLGAGNVLVLSGTNFETFYGFGEDTTIAQSSFFFGNGNDGYYLYYGGDENTGTLLDAYGVLDENGTGQAWEYEDSKATRNTPKTTNPNITWTASEWTISSADIADMTPGSLENEYRFVNNTWKPREAYGNATTSDDLVIISNLTTSSPLEANAFEVRSGTEFKIGAGQSLTAFGPITNNGTFTLLSNSLQYASLMATDAITGAINYERHVNGHSSVNGIGANNGNQGANDLISSPLASSQNFGAFATSNPNLFENSSNTSQKLFGPFDKTNGEFLTYDIITDATQPIENGIGYRVASNDNEGFTFTGSVIQTEVPVTIVNSGSFYRPWNLIGNPYPAYINVGAFLNHEVATGTKNLDLLLENSAAIYGYDGDASNGWTIWNLANASTKNIAPGQGFFIAAKPNQFNTGNLTLKFDPGMMSIDTTDDFIEGRLEQDNNARIKMQAVIGGSTHYTDFYFNDNSTSALDIGYDAQVYGGHPGPTAIYSNLVVSTVADETTGLAMGIQSLAYSNIGSGIVIPLGVHVPQGQQVSISIAESSLPNGIEVYLEDTATGIFTLLNTNDYVFTANSTLDSAGRFNLRFTEDSLTTAEQDLDALQIFTTQSPSALIVKGQLFGETTLNLFDVQGRLVLETNLNSQDVEQHISISHLQVGVYVVRLGNKTQIRTQKIIIK